MAASASTMLVQPASVRSLYSAHFESISWVRVSSHPVPRGAISMLTRLRSVGPSPCGTENQTPGPVDHEIFADMLRIHTVTPVHEVKPAADTRHRFRPHHLARRRREQELARLLGIEPGIEDALRRNLEVRVMRTTTGFSATMIPVPGSVASSPSGKRSGTKFSLNRARAGPSLPPAQTQIPRFHRSPALRRRQLRH